MMEFLYWFQYCRLLKLFLDPVSRWYFLLKSHKLNVFFWICSNFFRKKHNTPLVFCKTEWYNSTKENKNEKHENIVILDYYNIKGSEKILKDSFVISKHLIKSTRFLRLNGVVQALYIHLNADADDFGIVDVLATMRQTNASEQDLLTLFL